MSHPVVTAGAMSSRNLCAALGFMYSKWNDRFMYLEASGSIRLSFVSVKINEAK